MKVYTLTFSDFVNHNIVILGNFSSYANAWDALLADKDENMGDIALNHCEGIYSNPKLGFGSLDFTPLAGQDATYCYNVNVTFLDEVFGADDQIEL